MENEKISNIIKLIYEKRPLSKSEFLILDNLLATNEGRQEIDFYLNEILDKSESKDSNLKIEKIWAEIEKNEKRKSIKKKVRLITFMRKYAAILLLPFLLYTSFLTYQQYFKPAKSFSLKTDKGEQTKVILPDGTEVWLNVDTKLTYNEKFADNNRDITLNGEAFFNIKKNPKIPFIISSGNTKVKAIGTSFNINGYQDNILVKTSLSEGKIEVKVDDSFLKTESYVLVPGQEIRVHNKTGAVQLVTFDKNMAGAWRGMRLIFENTPFDEVIRKTERWYNVKIKYKPEEFKNDGLTVRLNKGESLEKLFEIIDETIGIEYKQEKNNISLTKK